MAERKIYVLKIELAYSSPKIWRRVEVPSDYTFFKLHKIIQEVMLWEDYHLHKFEIQTLLGTIVPDENGSGRNEKRMFLSDYIEIAKKIEYIYDFGDCWEHKIKLEDIKEEKKGITYPRCTGGKNATPPEDCGGIDGYYEMLEIIQGKQSKRKKEVLEWLGEEFDPGVFDISLIKFPKRLCTTSNKDQKN